MKRTIAIGSQSFEDIRKSDCFYIDKTYFIKEWLDCRDSVTLITRPRRFGKTLNMDMLNCFLSNRFANRGDLFKGLSIWQEEKYRKLQGSYPVIFFSFAGIKDKNYKDTIFSINNIIFNLYDESRFLLESEKLSNASKSHFETYGEIKTESELLTSIKFLSKCYYEHFGKKVIILLDEYDTPLQEAYLSGYWDEFSGFIRNLFNNTFKSNPYLDRAIMTGITRISKESFFSDLNNMEVSTVTSNKYETCFGFTEKEVFDSLDTYGMSDQKNNIKAWYDGFVFGNSKDIYNPWSIINFLDKKKFVTYWTNTSSNKLPSMLIQKSSPEVMYVMQDLLHDKTFESAIDEQVIFDQIDNDENLIWSLLLASGYIKPLKITSKGNDFRMINIYELTLTNFEVKSMFSKMFAQWFNTNKSYNRFISSLLKNNTEEMTDYMNEISQSTFSYYDTAKDSQNKTSERFYHGFVLGMLVDLRDKYQILSNRESGYGRYDIMLVPKQPNQNAYVIEFKVFNPQKEASIKETIKSGLEQIKAKNYDADLLSRNISKDRIFHYCFAFEGKKVLIG